MGWFAEQIKQREKNDNQLFEDSFFDVASLILGEKTAESIDDCIITQHEIDRIMKYYRFRPVKIPENLKTNEERLDYCLKFHGFMKRRIILEKDWFTDAYGPVFAYKKDGEPVALLPNKVIGYHFTDRKTGRIIFVSHKNADILQDEAYCFYKPFPYFLRRRHLSQ